MTCPIWGHSALSPGATTLAADAGGTIVVVHNVPADVCDNCGEAFVSDPIAATLEDPVIDARTAAPKTSSATSSPSPPKEPSVALGAPPWLLSRNR